MFTIRKILLFAALSANFIGINGESQTKAEIIDAPFFSEGENLSFDNCGKWNKSVSHEFPPWSALIYFNSALSQVAATIISPRTILRLVYVLSDEEINYIKNGLANVHIGECRLKKTCTLDDNKGSVVKILDFTQYYKGGISVTLFTTEKMPKFNDFFAPICLFNRGNQFDFEEQTANSNYQTWHYTWRHPERVKMEPIERCLNNKTIANLQNQEPSPLKWLICISRPFKWMHNFLTNFYEGRHFLRGQDVDEYNYDTHGLDHSKHGLYRDHLSLIQWIARNSPDISLLPSVPPAKTPNKKFKGSQNLSFPECGVKAKTRNEAGSAGITNGTNAEHPWHAEIDSPLGSCGGTLISKTTVLTAAHCLTNLTASDVRVTLGLRNKSLRAGTQTKIPSKLIMHQNYSSATLENDVVLLIFDQGFDLNENVRPICLWNENFALEHVVGKNAVAVGWGMNENYQHPDLLQEVQMPVKSFKDCYLAHRPFFGTFLKPGKTFCAGYTTNGTSVCNGDTGGGISIERNGKWFIRGIVSFGRSQIWRNEFGIEETVCQPNLFSLFADVATYMDWIVENTPDISYDN